MKYIILAQMMCQKKNSYTVNAYLLLHSCYIYTIFVCVIFYLNIRNIFMYRMNFLKKPIPRTGPKRKYEHIIFHVIVTVTSGGTNWGTFKNSKVNSHVSKVTHWRLNIGKVGSGMVTIVAQFFFF